MSDTALKRMRRVAFGQVVTAHRLTLNLTQDELAEAIGSSRYLINKVESGQYPLRVDRLYRLADALATKLSDLLQATSDKVTRDLEAK